MMSNLTSPERARAMLITGAGVLIGLTMAIVGRNDPMGAHGWIVLLFCGVLFFVVGDKLYNAEPTEDRSISYYDDPTKVGILLALFWAVVAMGMGVWVASQLAWPVSSRNDGSHLTVEQRQPDCIPLTIQQPRQRRSNRA